ncbi:GW dipeptide domain-containing protein [Kordia sp.]|uniref:GW dipeptide domain-containing protein n=1 Tax=Kordia sp. TaxID=1965332 RepID=UPI003D2DA36F
MSIFIIISMLCSLTSCEEKNDSKKEISFIAVIDSSNATKGGIYINGYVVEIDYDEVKKLNGKKVRITGKTKTEKGVDNTSKGNNEIIKQGRSKDVIHIVTPKIEIIN